MVFSGKISPLGTTSVSHTVSPAFNTLKEVWVAGLGQTVPWRKHLAANLRARSARAPAAIQGPRPRPPPRGPAEFRRLAHALECFFVAVCEVLLRFYAMKSDVFRNCVRWF